MPKVVITLTDEGDLHMERAPKGVTETGEHEVLVDIPSGLFNDYMRVKKRINALESHLTNIWSHAKTVGNGRRYG